MNDVRAVLRSGWPSSQERPYVVDVDDRQTRSRDGEHPQPDAPASAFSPDSVVTIERLMSEDRSEAIEVVARGMADNPLHVAAYGADPRQRVASHRLLLTAATDVLGPFDIWVARSPQQILGAAGMVQPDRCRPTAVQQLQLVPTLLSLGLGPQARVRRWLSQWSKHDPDHRHVHVGPVAVHPDHQGRGLGTLLMAKVCSELDAAGVPGYLETDKEQNVAFYERCGFEVVASDRVIGVRNWFMSRPPSAGDIGIDLDEVPC